MGIRRFHRPATALTASAAMLAVGLVGFAGSPAAHAAETYPMPATGTVTVHGHGNGHGHGMSQYGARGAAIAGHSAAYIAAFYYPGTSLTTLSSTIRIRVYLPGAGGNTCIQAKAGLTATGVSGTLPTTGITRYRLVPYGTGLALQKGTGSGCSGSGWSNLKTGLPARVDIGSTQGYVHMYRSDGTSTDYRGSVGAVRNGTGELTINRLGLDAYAMGVTPREMPASWQPAAVQAQAIAARSYGEYEREHHAAALYDICDSDQCQVYGGMTHYDAGGAVVWRDYPAAVTGNNNEVIRYNGATAFTQFSASSGGWTVDGGQPYLVAKQDPYDNSGTGDPYLNWTRTPSVAQIASYYGLARLTSIVITARDGHGDWGGRVLSATVNGVDGGGTSRGVSTTGFELQSAMGLPHNWFTFDQSAPSAPTNVVAAGLDGGVTVTWGTPTSSGTQPITGYIVTVGTQTATVDAAVRSATIIGLVNGRTVSVAVRAKSIVGASPAATTSATPNAVPQLARALVPLRLFDTRSPAVPVDASHPLTYAFAGKGGVPATAGAAVAVQFALTIVSPSASGTLHVQTAGAPVGTTAAIAYRRGRTVTTTVSAPITPTSSVRFVPSAGSMALIADQMSYSGPGLSTVASVAPVRVAYLQHVPVGDGLAVAVRGVAGVPADANAVVLGVAGGPATGSGWLRIWPDGLAAPGVNQVTVTADGSGANTVVVPIGSNGNVRIGSSTSAIGAQLTVLGYLAPAATGRGLFETFQSTGMADTGAGVGKSLSIGTTPVSLVVLGKPQVPHSNVQAALLEVTVSGAAENGGLYAYAAGSARPAAYALTFPKGGASTTTVLVRIGADGAIQLSTSRPTAIVAVDIAGWVNVG